MFSTYSQTIKEKIKWDCYRGLWWELLRVGWPDK
jgi:hypothetical protein